ncbi:hypothetical protein FHS61_002875 [Altererythrobacter atlanticus]|uniref:Uncharacterized protein n=1 Tax=Croceibacterium atlanticum TaxID=1267766 RepID=A0A0F7KWT6_9SPHN|nr:hypothetical protein [Croceibacterium atlanticum]AKH43687.1 hypothetical protein WYH_02657 [Croceibacterium atlanticum]MBB5733829.1 hypothetical protein [Croceibacterium atlanticum]
MANPDSSSGAKWFWALVVILLFVLLAVWFLDPFGETPEPAPAETPNPDFTTAPEEPGVPVDLPDTPMTNTPVEEPGATEAPAQ